MGFSQSLLLSSLILSYLPIFSFLLFFVILRGCIIIHPRCREKKTERNTSKWKRTARRVALHDTVLSVLVNDCRLSVELNWIKLNWFNLIQLSRWSIPTHVFRLQCHIVTSCKSSTLLWSTSNRTRKGFLVQCSVWIVRLCQFILSIELSSVLIDLFKVDRVKRRGSSFLAYARVRLKTIK